MNENPDDLNLRYVIYIILINVIYYYIFFSITNICLYFLRNLYHVSCVSCILWQWTTFDTFTDNSGLILQLGTYHISGSLGMFMFIYRLHNALFPFRKINLRFTPLGDAFPSMSSSCIISSHFLIRIAIYNKSSMTSINHQWKLRGTWNQTYNWQTEGI